MRHCTPRPCLSPNSASVHPWPRRPPARPRPRAVSFPRTPSWVGLSPSSQPQLLFAWAVGSPARLGGQDVSAQMEPGLPLRPWAFLPPQPHCHRLQWGHGSEDVVQPGQQLLLTTHRAPARPLQPHQPLGLALSVPTAETLSAPPQPLPPLPHCPILQGSGRIVHIFIAVSVLE